MHDTKIWRADSPRRRPWNETVLQVQKPSGPNVDRVTGEFYSELGKKNWTSQIRFQSTFQDDVWTFGQEWTFWPTKSTTQRKERERGRMREREKKCRNQGSRKEIIPIQWEESLQVTDVVATLRNYFVVYQHVRQMRCYHFDIGRVAVQYCLILAAFRLHCNLRVDGGIVSSLSFSCDVNLFSCWWQGC